MIRVDYLIQLFITGGLMRLIQMVQQREMYGNLQVNLSTKRLMPIGISTVVLAV